MKLRIAIAGFAALIATMLCLQPAWSQTAAPSPSPTASPTPSQEQVSRGAELFNHGRFAEALKFFNLAVKLDAKNAFALAYRGRTYFLMDRFDKSLSDLDLGLTLQPNDYLLHWLRGLTLWSMGVNGSAAEDFQATFRVNPALRSYMTMSAALAYRDDGNASAARALLVACKKLCSDKKAFSYLGDRYLFGEITASTLLHATKTKWDKSDAHALIGLTYLQHGDARSAKPYFIWIIRNASPDDDWIPNIRQRLKRMH